MRLDIKGAIVNDDEAWVYDFFGISNVAPKKVLAAISEAQKTNDVLDVHINSGGGKITAGAEIYEALRSYGNVKIHIVQACSAASVIMCAGKSEITPVGMVMIHNVHGTADGDNRDLQHAAGVLKTADSSIAAAYAYKTGKSVEHWLGLMAKETWMTAAQAVECGLVDEISASTCGFSQLAAVNGNLIPDSVIENMRNQRSEARAQLELLKLKNGGKN